METPTTMDEPQKRKGSRVKWTMRCAILATLVVAWWLAFHRDKAERLYEHRYPGVRTDFDNKEYGFNYKGSAIEFYSTSISTGRRTLIGTDELGTKKMAASSYTPAGVFYLVQNPIAPSPGASVTTSGAGRAQPGEIVNLGNFLHSPDRRFLPGENVTTITYASRPHRSLPEVRWMPLSGSGPRTLRINTLGQPLDGAQHEIDTNGVYWIRSEKLKYFSVTVPISRKKTGYWSEYEPSASLMYSAYDGSPPVQVASGLVSGSLLWKTKSFLFWKNPRVYPDRTNDVYCLRISDKKQWKIAEVQGNDYFAPNEVDGRIYWAEGKGHSVMHVSADRLMSVAADGTDRHVELDAWKSGRQIATWLVAQRGYPVASVASQKGFLYVFLVREAAGEKTTVSDGGVYRGVPGAYKRFLIKFKPGNPGRILGEMDLSQYKTESDAWIDSEYVYFSRVDDVTSWWDWLYPVTTARSMSFMYRVPLPK